MVICKCNYHFIIMRFCLILSFLNLFGCTSIGRFFNPELVEPDSQFGRECCNQARQSKDECELSAKSYYNQCMESMREMANDAYTRKLDKYYQDIKWCETQYKQAWKKWKIKQDIVVRCRQMAMGNNEQYNRCGRGVSEPQRWYYCAQYAEPNFNDITREYEGRCNDRLKKDEGLCIDKFYEKWKACEGQILRW